MAPKACPECGSRKWRRDGVTGNAVCEDGHVYQDFRSENLVMDATGITLQKRRLKGPERVNRRKEEGQTNKEYYHGQDAEWLKIQAFQLLLRTQIQALSKLWSLPDTYEMIVRDLWAYQLAMCTLPPRPSSSGEDTNDAGNDIDDEKETAKEEGSASDKSGSDSEPEIDPDLLNEIEGLSDEDQENGPKQEGANSAKKKRPLHISDTLVCLIVGLWTIRYPILNVDLERNHIPYIDFGRTNAIPEELYRRINRDIMLALCPGRCPTPRFLHLQSHQLARFIHLRHGLTTPEINLPPLAWRVISSLGGTPTTYAQVQRLLALIDVNCSLYDTTVVSRLRRRRGRRNNSLSEGQDQVECELTTRYEDVWLPELAVAGAWVILMQISYGLDYESRCALAKSDPLVGLPNGDGWVQELNKRRKEESLATISSELDNIDFSIMPESELEQFLEKAQTVLVKDRRNNAADRAIDVANVFPLPSLDSGIPQADARPSWSKYHASMVPTMHQIVNGGLANKELPLLPGEAIRSYRANDFTGTLPPSYETVSSAAAEVIGVRPRDILKVVEVFERRLEKKRPGRSRSLSRAGSTSSHHRSRPSEGD